MDIDKIKLELVVRTKNLDLPVATPNPDPVEAITNKLGSVVERGEIATRKMAEILNDILVEDGIDFETEDEKQDFLVLIKPTFATILKEKLNESF